jgi:hypothetical protein
MIRNNLKENSGFLPWYQCGCWFTQCKGRETIAPSHGSFTGNSKEKLFVSLWARVNHHHIDERWMVGG